MKLRALSTLIPFVLLAGVTIPVVAAPYWGSAEIARWEASVRPETGPAIQIEPREASRRITYEEMYARTCEFLDVWQVHDPGHPEFGGMREGEDMPDIIQTDNTSESIWVWTRYYEMTGDNQYYQNILDAFTYSMNFPAYLEEGGSGTVSGYYRMYNCGWATRAELKYRQIYGDDTYKAYGDSCASYIAYNYLTRPATGFYSFVNPAVFSWALGNLYHVGTHAGNEAWRAAAVDQADRSIKTWVEEEPTLLANEIWAMSGGATMWGLLNSYFIAHPESVTTWVPAYKDFMDTFSSPGEFQNAWNGWYAWGHRATGEILADAFHLGVHVALTDTLMAQDTDEDGGIPVAPQNPNTWDQTWVTNYLSVMGLSPLLPPESAAPSQVLPSQLNLALEGNLARGSLRLSYTLPQDDLTTVALYDCAGREVRELVAAQRGSGTHTLAWNGRDERGRPVPAGAYWAVLQTPSELQRRRFIWMR